jgi:alpha-tubulin suppressor-like RCC1 family protein
MPTAFACTLKGSEPFTYQWLFNGAPIAGATGNSLVITKVTMANAGAYQVAVTNTYGNALSSTGFLYAGHTMIVGWGQGAYSGPPAPLGLTNAVQLALNVYIVSALKSDGTVTSWGLNEYGLVSYVTNLSNIVSIATGGPHELALTRDGTVIGWGYNFYGSANVPAGLSNVVAISANGYLSMALRNDGKVFCWGQNNFGQTNVPVTLSNVVAIAAGPDHCVALRRDGTVACWGNGALQYPPPANLSNVVAIAAGGATSQAIRMDGTIVAWGNPQETNVPPGMSNLFQVVEGQYHNLAVRNDGTVTAWLYADGSSSDRGQTNVPPWLSNVVSIAAAYNLSMAIMADTPPLSHAAIIGSTKLNPGAPFQVQISTQNGRVYGLEYSDSLPATNWNSLPLQAGTGGLVTFSDSGATTTARYYRIRRW